MSDLLKLYGDIFNRNNTNHNAHGLEVLGGFAKIAANQFCNSKISLNETIQKLAYENKLNPDQINIVACEANKAVHAHLFSVSEDKYIRFPLADSKKIIDSLQINIEKNASINIDDEDDYSFQPSYFSSNEKIAYYSSAMDEDDLTNIKLKLEKENIKIAKQLSENELNLFNLKEKISKSISSFKKIASELVLNEPEHKYLDSLRMVYEFTKAASSEYIADELCQDLQKKIERLTLKKASFKNDEYISNDVINKCQVINSNHPLYMELKTISENISNQDSLNRKNLELINIQKELTSRILRV